MMTTPKTTATRQFAGLVLVRVEAAQLDSLRVLLDEVGRQTIDAMHGHPAADPIVPFHALETVHYARFVLVDRDADGPLPEPMLAFSTNYDGPEGEESCSGSRALRHHVDELVRVASPGLERVFQCCQGYRQGRLAEYLTRNQHKASTFYVGSPGRSRNQILWEAAFRRRVDDVLDAGQWEGWKPEQVREEVLKQLKPQYPNLPAFPSQPNLEVKVKAFQSAIGALALLVIGLAIFAAWRLLPADVGMTPTLWHRLIRIGTIVGTALFAIGAPGGLLVWYFRSRERTDPQFQPEYSADVHERFRVASTDENYFLQNQLTHLVAIKPGVLRWVLIRVVFMALQVLATNRYNKGKLGGIPSIHFARWVLLPNRGVLFFSNFDSSWQSYLGDFINKASNGLTAVWSNTVGYPRTTWLVSAGSRDASRFLAWTRHHQLPTQVWYGAYPGLSIVNINANTEIRRGLADRGSVDAATWLFRLRAVDRLGADQLFSEEKTREAPLSLKDIQGIILKGYGFMPEARFVMFQVQDRREDLLAWLSELPLTSAEEASRDIDPPEPLVNVAFSHCGLRALGVDDTLCERFSTPFVQDSNDEYRARVNGDVGASAPDQWAWGSTEHPVHVVLLIYAKTKDSVDRYVAQYTAEAEHRGLQRVHVLEGTTLAGRKEHFGFRDGIAQPVIEGSGRAEVGGNTIAAGEILLGHRDGYGNVADSPASSAGFAFGYNGSYLVLRQLEQNVEAFWKDCAERRGDDEAVMTASKMVGRWPSGAPLVRHPASDPDDSRFMDEDDFSYLGNDEDNDRYGARCPFGAHIRRANPRDWNLGETPGESMKLANLHRIIRRGRAYGPPLDPSMSPAVMIAKARTAADTDNPEARGLQFLCFNANIERQFEFIQQQWLNNPKFAGLNSDADPLLGNQCPVRGLDTDTPSFVIQSDVKHGLIPRATGIQNFCRVIGSGYFFMPSLPAVKLLRGGLRVAPAADQLEAPPPDEQLHIDSLIDTLREKMKRDYVGGKTLRDAHPKMHGCVKARFTVEAGIDASLKVGLFSVPKTYDAWVRFSNQDGTVSADSKPDIRGVAIKLMGVPGAKLLDGQEACTTHDFILISNDAFVTRNVAEFDALVKALVAGHMPGFLLGHLRVAYKLFRSLKKHSSPLEIQYFSAVPSLFGTTAVKYSLKPSSTERTPIPPRPSTNYLREALKARLLKGSASFDFLVQRRGDPAKMPIEDPSVSWQERDAAFQKVATLEIPMQDFDTPARQEFGDNLSFNPWRCLPEHRPLGGISRARRQVYRALSSFRHDRNAAPREEPGVEA